MDVEKGLEREMGTRGENLSAHTALTMFLHQRTTPAPSSAPRVPHIPNFTKFRQKKCQMSRTHTNVPLQLSSRGGEFAQRRDRKEVTHKGLLKAPRGTTRQQPVPEDNPALELGQRTGNNTGNRTDRLILGTKARTG